MSKRKFEPGEQIDLMDEATMQKYGRMSFASFYNLFAEQDLAPFNMQLVTRAEYTWRKLFAEANPAVEYTKENLHAWNEHIKQHGINIPWRPGWREYHQWGMSYWSYG